MIRFFLALVTAGGASLLMSYLLVPAGRTAERVARLTEENVRPPTAKLNLQGFRRWARRADALLQSVDPARGLDRLLWQANLSLSPAEFLGLCLLAGGLIGVAGWVWASNILVLALALLAGPGIGLLLLRHRASANVKALSAQLPDALLLIVNALRAGHGMLQAVRIVSAQLAFPAGREFGVVLSEINLGLPVERAFTNLSERTGLVEVDLAVGAILVQREVGGNLAEILSNIQETLRDRTRITGEVHALTSQGRLSGWVLSLLPAGVGAMFSVLNPSYLQPFLLDYRGRVMATVAVGLQLLGMLAIRKIVAIKY